MERQATRTKAENLRGTLIVLHFRPRDDALGTVVDDECRLTHGVLPRKRLTRNHQDPILRMELSEQVLNTVIALRHRKPPLCPAHGLRSPGSGRFRQRGVIFPIAACWMRAFFD